MKKLLSTNYSANAFNIAMLLLRITFGVLMMKYGYNKLIHFAEIKGQFINFLGIGSTMSLALVIFAEFFCSLFLIIGLFTRLAAIPLVISCSVALFKAHQGDIFDTGEKATLYLVAFLILLLVGPGRVSVDSMTGK